MLKGRNEDAISEIWINLFVVLYNLFLVDIMRKCSCIRIELRGVYFPKTTVVIRVES